MVESGKLQAPDILPKWITAQAPTEQEGAWESEPVWMFLEK